MKSARSMHPTHLIDQNRLRTHDGAKQAHPVGLAENPAASNVYERLGFARYRDYREATAVMQCVCMRLQKGEASWRSGLEFLCV